MFGRISRRSTIISSPILCVSHMPIHCLLYFIPVIIVGVGKREADVWSHTHIASKSDMDQPGKVANPARG